MSGEPPRPLDEVAPLDAAATEPDGPTQTAGSAPGRVVSAIVMTATLVAILATVNQIFGYSSMVMGRTLLLPQFLYLLITLLLPLVFLVKPSFSGGRRVTRGLDVALATATAVSAAYLMWNSRVVLAEAWALRPPPIAVVAAIVLWIAILEGTRRAGGGILAGVFLVVSVYPLFADRLPAFFAGHAYTIERAAAFHILSREGLTGTVLDVFAVTIIGYLLFGAVLLGTGAAESLMNIVTALVGSMRGGAAKISAFASALFGSMSGSVFSNVLTTGAVTIPLMRKAGFSPRRAAAIEACASTGGVLMPPVMGAVAFIMASLLGVAYVEIVLIAIVPSLLYYAALLLHIDAYSARQALRGSGREAHQPSLWNEIRNGLPHLVGIAVLTYLILVPQLERRAPYYAILVALLVHALRSRRRLRRLWEQLQAIAREAADLLIFFMPIVAGVGVIMGAVTMTGMAQAVSTEIVILAGGSGIALLLLAAGTSLVLGTGLAILPAYIFLAVTVAPALTQSGYDPILAHLFILYWATISYITPPVALGAVTAAPIAGATGMAASLTALRMGAILYALPFYFVMNPAMTFRAGTVLEGLLVIGGVLLGLALLAAGLEGYVWGLGSIELKPVASGVVRTLLVVGGILVGVPEGPSFLEPDVLGGASLVGLVLSGAALVLLLVARRLGLFAREKVLV